MYECSSQCKSTRGLSPKRVFNPIVAIHGSASSGGLWNKLKDEYASDRKVLTPALSGYGKHDSRRLNLHSTLRSRAEPIIESIREMNEQVDLVAHSFGASVAMQIVRVLPKHIRSMTFYEPVIPALLRDSGKVADIELLGDLVALSEIVKGTASNVGMETFINFWSSPGTWEGLDTRTQAKLSELSPIVYQDFVEAYLNLAPNALNRIGYAGPLKILVGENVNTHALRMARILMQHYPQSSIHSLQDMGHMGPLTHPDEVHTQIMHHIREVDWLLSNRKGTHLARY